MVMVVKPPSLAPPAAMRWGSRVRAPWDEALPRATTSTDASTEGMTGSVGVVRRSGIQRPVPSGSNRATWSVPSSKSALFCLLPGTWMRPALTYFHTWPPRRSSPMYTTSGCCGRTRRAAFSCRNRPSAGGGAPGRSAAAPLIPPTAASRTGGIVHASRDLREQREVTDRSGVRSTARRRRGARSVHPTVVGSALSRER
jgi:hypothetical protein